MNKFIEYLNETLISLDIPTLINVDERPTYSRNKKSSKSSNNSQKK